MIFPAAVEGSCGEKVDQGAKKAGKKKEDDIYSIGIIF